MENSTKQKFRAGESKNAYRIEYIELNQYGVWSPFDFKTASANLQNFPEGKLQADCYKHLRKLSTDCVWM